MPAATVPAGGRGSRGSSRIYRRAITGPHFRYSRCKGIFGVQFFQEGQYDLVQNDCSNVEKAVFCGENNHQDKSNYEWWGNVYNSDRKPMKILQISVKFS